MWLLGLWLGLTPTAVAEIDPGESILVLEVTGRDEHAETRRIANELVASELQSLDGIDIVTEADIKRAVDLESSRIVMGCDTESCLAELAGAYDAALVVFGSLGQLDGTWVLTLNLFDSKLGRSRAREVLQVASSREFPRAIADAVPRLLGREVVEAPPAERPWLVGGGLVAAGLIGALGLGGLAVASEVGVAEPGVDSRTRDGRRVVGVGALAGAAVCAVAASVGGVMLALPPGGE